MASRRYLALTPLFIACYSAGEDGGGAPAGSAGNSGSAGSTSTIPQGFLTCSQGELFHLTGDADGQAIDINEAPTLGGFHQSDAPPYSMFRLPNETDSVPDLVNIELTWGGVVANGEVAVIEGWVLMPPTGPLAGETICAGPGSTMIIPATAEQDASGEFLFRMLDLSLGSACDQAVAGELDGCWRN